MRRITIRCVNIFTRQIFNASPYLCSWILWAFYRTIRFILRINTAPNIIPIGSPQPTTHIPVSFQFNWRAYITWIHMILRAPFHRIMIPIVTNRTNSIILRGGWIYRISSTIYLCVWIRWHIFRTRISVVTGQNLRQWNNSGFELRRRRQTKGARRVSWRDCIDSDSLSWFRVRSFITWSLNFLKTSS